MARTTYLRPPATAQRPVRRTPPPPPASTGAPRRGRVVIGGLLLLVLVIGGAAVFLLTTGNASLSTDSAALARIDMPFQGGKIEGVIVTTGPHARRVPIYLKGDQIWPTKLLRANQKVTIDVVVKRPGWSAWLNGKTQKLHMTMITPVASLKQHYLTLNAGEPVTLKFKEPVRTFSYGEPGNLVRRVLHSPLSVIKLKRTAPAGTALVAAAPRAWETSKAAVISWFPAGSSTATAVSSPAPGTKILPTTKITLTFSKTVDQALGNHRPPVEPTTPGTWHTINSHTIQFQPTGYGYGLGAHVSIGMPTSVRLIGGQSGTVLGQRQLYRPRRLAAPAAAAARPARLPAAQLPYQARRRLQRGGTTQRRGQAPQGKLQLALVQRPVRAARRVEARRHRPDDPRRADGLRERSRTDHDHDRRGRQPHGVEGAVQRRR